VQSTIKKFKVVLPMMGAILGDMCCYLMMWEIRFMRGLGTPHRWHLACNQRGIIGLAWNISTMIQFGMWAVLVT